MMKSGKIVWRIIGVLAAVAVSFLVIFPLVQKLSDKLYKKCEQKKEIDFDNLGPEVVRKDEYEEE